MTGYLDPTRDGRDILAPQSTGGTAPDGSPLTGVGIRRITPDDPQWDVWDAYLRWLEASTAETSDVDSEDVKPRRGRRPGGM